MVNNTNTFKEKGGVRDPYNHWSFAMFLSNIVDDCQDNEKMNNIMKFFKAKALTNICFKYDNIDSGYAINDNVTFKTPLSLIDDFYSEIVFFNGIDNNVQQRLDGYFISINNDRRNTFKPFSIEFCNNKDDVIFYVTSVSVCLTLQFTKKHIGAYVVPDKNIVPYNNNSIPFDPSELYNVNNNFNPKVNTDNSNFGVYNVNNAKSIIEHNSNDIEEFNIYLYGEQHSHSPKYCYNVFGTKKYGGECVYVENVWGLWSIISNIEFLIRKIEIKMKSNNINSNNINDDTEKLRSLDTRSLNLGAPEGKNLNNCYFDEAFNAIIGLIDNYPFEIDMLHIELENGERYDLEKGKVVDSLLLCKEVIMNRRSEIVKINVQRGGNGTNEINVNTKEDPRTAVTDSNSKNNGGNKTRKRKNDNGNN